MLSIAQFLSLRTPMRALIFLFWIYSFVGSAVGVFIHIYLYVLFDSVRLNIVFALLGFAGIMIGFCAWGAITALFRLNAKYGFLLSFIFSGVGLLLLSNVHGLIGACVAMTVKGVGAGLFWLAIHTYELVETRDDERDSYSTFLSAGQQIVNLAGPAFATLLIWGSQQFGLGEFTLLFATMPPIYLAGFVFFGALTDYRPAPIKSHDLKHFLTDRRNQVAQLYLAGGAGNHILLHILVPLAAIVVLGTALRVGGFNTLFAIMGTLVLLAVGARRHPRNRLTILGIASVVLVVLNLMLGLSLTIITLVIYTVGVSIMQPVMRVSQHVIDLQTMDSVGHQQSDFYPTMIFRDLSLWVWRTVAGLVLLVAVSFAGTGREAISVGMYFIAATIEPLAK